MDVESGINSTMINESTCVDGSEMLEENFANGKNKGETKSNIKIKNNYLLTNFFTVKPEIKNKLIFHKNEDKMDEETEKITQPEFFKRNLGCLKMSDWSEERVNKFEQNTLHIFHSFSKNQNSNQLKFSFGKAAKGYESIENIKTNLISKLKNNKKIDSEERTKKRMILQKTQMANDEQLGSDKKIVPEENPENKNKNTEDMIITENKTLISINYQKNNINNNIEFAEDFLKNPTNFVNSQKKGRKIQIRYEDYLNDFYQSIGEFKKTSKLIKPTNPFIKDEDLIDYIMSSDEEKEEQEAESIGESKKSSDSEDSEFEEEDNFVVPDGHLSESEVASMDEEEKNIIKKRGNNAE